MHPSTATPGFPRPGSSPVNAAGTDLLPRLRLAAAPTSPWRILLQTLALVFTSGLSSSHRVLSSRLLNSLLPQAPRRLLPALLRFLPGDHLTLLLLVSSRHHARSLPTASALHALAVSSGHLPSDLRLANALLSLYLSIGSPVSARCLLSDIPRPDTVTWNTLLRACLRLGLIPAARRLFDEMPARDVVSYNSMVAGYVAEGDMTSAKNLFDEMVQRDVVTWNSIISGYARNGDMENARKMFDAMPERDVVSWNSMLDGYAQAGDVEMARLVFDGMAKRSIVSWNVILALYAKAREWRKCLELFDAMIAEGDTAPNEKTFVSVLTACANLGDLEKGRWVHGLVRKRWERLVPDVLLLTALLTMYAKCGVMETARQIFDSMSEKSVPSWNSMIIGYGLHGQGKKALELFLEMERDGPRPNETTFICVLSSCAHGGFVLEGWWCFNRMVSFYNIVPKSEHFGCMMDLLGRAGLLENSGNLIENLRGNVSPALWAILMSTSQTQNNTKLGEFVGKKLIEIRPTEVGPYILLSNIYAAEGRWGDVEKVRKMMKEKGVEKDAGLSLVGSRVELNLITEGDTSAPRNDMMVSMLAEMGAHMKQPSEESNRRKISSTIP